MVEGLALGEVMLNPDNDRYIFLGGIVSAYYVVTL